MPRRDLRSFALVLLAAVVPFAPALTGGFVFDDHPAIVKNPRVTNGSIASARALRDLFAGGSYWREEEVGYRPLATLSFRAERALFGERAWGFHATNLALHAANALLVARLAARALGGIGAAVLGGAAGVDAGGGAAAPLVAALLFAVHPAQTEAVAGIAAGRAELLCALFALLALSRRRGALLTGALYLCALLSKESAFPLPLLWLLTMERQRGAHAARGGAGPAGAAAAESRWRSSVPLGVGFAAALGAYLALRHGALGRIGGFAPSFLDNPLAHAPRAALAAGVLRVASEYARLALFPVALSADYGYDAVPLPARLGVAALPGLALGAAVAGAAAWAWARRRDSRPARCALALAVTLAIPLHLVAPLPALCAERLLYLPSVFAALFVAAIAFQATPTSRVDRARPGARSPRARRAALLALACAGVALAVRSAARAADWRSDLALFASSARAKPGSARAHNALGVALRGAGRDANAEAAFRRALAIYPRYASALANLGNVAFARGAVDSAIAFYEAALAERPAFERARWNLAVAHERRGDAHAAAREYAAIAAADPTHFESRLRLGELLAAAGRRDEARRPIEEALALRPGEATALRALGRLAVE
jgi:Flp pilus assembly protein TadD